MISDDSNRLVLLNEYNEIVRNLFQEATVDREKKDKKTNNIIVVPRINTIIWGEAYAGANERVEKIKSNDPDFFRPNNYEIMDLDLLDDGNVAKVLLYSAIVKQWPSLNPINYFSETQKQKVDVFGRRKIKTIINNLIFITSQQCLANLRNPAHGREVKSLLRTLALYFFIRVAGESMEVNLTVLSDRSFADPRSIIYLNPEFEALLRGLHLTNLARYIFKDIITGEMSDFECKLERLFDYTIRNSYYIPLPKELYGLTAVGSIIFVSIQYRDQDPLNAGVTLVILLHEMAHLSKRLSNSQRMFFELTPRDFRSPSDAEKSIGEFQIFLEPQLFGNMIDSIFLSGAEYITDLENWDKPIEVFQSEFKNAQIHSERLKEHFMCLEKAKKNQIA